MRGSRFAIAGALVIFSTAVASAAAPVVVNQIRRAFSVREVRISQGDTIRFSNVDEFLHQLSVASPTFKFSSAEQAPGQVVDIAFSKKGTFEVRCEIHPKMLITVVVE